MPATEVVSTAVETTAELAAPVVNAGTLDYKKVAMIAGGTVVVAGCAYLAYRAIKKRKAKKAETVEVNPETEEAATE